MKKISCDFSCMVPTIIFEENIISQLILITRQKKLYQLVLIAQVLVKNSKIEFHCSTLVTDPDSEISVREDEVPIYVDILPESEFKQPTNIEVDDFQKNFYRMMEETSNQYNANNIYSLISDVTYMNNQLNVRLSLFCPKSSIEIEEIDSSDAPTVCSIPGATYRFPKDKKFKDPNSIYAVYYGINGIKDPRIYSLSYSIYLQHHKKINAAFNNKLYRITFHENNEFELLSTSFCISKPSCISTKFNQFNLSTTNVESEETSYMKENIQYKQENQECKTIYAIPKEIMTSISNLKKEIGTLKEEIKKRDQIISDKLDQHDKEIKTLLQAILAQIKTPHNHEKSSKIFPHRQICRKPVIPLEITLASSFETQTTTSDFTQQKQSNQQFQQAQQIQNKQKQISRSRSENINNQIPSPQQNFNQHQNSTQNRLFPMNSTNSMDSINSMNLLNSNEQEKQKQKNSENVQNSIEKRRSISKDSLNISAPSLSSNKRTSPTNSINSSAIVENTTNPINATNIPTTNNNNNNNNNSKVNLDNIKYMNSSNSNSKKVKTSTLNDDFSSKYSKPFIKFSNQMFNEPSFDISCQIPDSLNESPNKRENTNIQSEFSFLFNNETSMDTNKFYEVIGYSKTPNP